MRIRVEVPCRPTESVDKVTRALRNLFPDVQVESTQDGVVGHSTSVDRLRELIRNQRIRDAARRQLIAGRREDRTTVVLSKQAAFVGVVNFGSSSPLGDILVVIESDDLDAVIDRLAESTVARSA